MHSSSYLCLVIALCISLSYARTFRQASRSEVVNRDFSRRAVGLQPRSSAQECATIRDSNGNCCATDTTIEVAGRSWCSEAVFTDSSCTSQVCCPYGGSQVAITLDLSGGQPGGTRLGQCCTPGPVPAENNTPNAHCQNVSRKRHELAFDLASRPVKRGTIDDPLRQMSFRHGSWRTRLSPHLLADFLLNDFQFSYRDHTFIDHHAREQGGAAFRKQKLRVDPNFAMPKASPYIGFALMTAYDKGLRHISIYRDWELAIDDLPELLRAMVEHPKWPGVYHLHGQEYDEFTLRAIASKIPTFNATIHDTR